LRNNKAADALSLVGLALLTRQYAGHVARSFLAALRRWQRDDAASLAAAVSYYLALSLFPVMLLLTGGLGLAMRYSQLGSNAHQQILAVVSEHCSPSLESKIVHVLDQFQNQSLANGPIGFLTTLMAALGVFYQFERAFDKIWRIPPPPPEGWLRTTVQLVRRRISAFFILAGVGVTIFSILMVNVAVGALSRWIGNLYAPGALLLSSLDSLITVTINALAFSFLYYKLPKRPVQRSAAFRGGMMVSILWEVGRQLLATFVIGVQYTTAYGAIGSFICLLLWFYWGVALLLFGAEYVVVLTRCSCQPVNLFARSKRLTTGEQVALSIDSVKSLVTTKSKRNVA
jgi:membrane protein